jgi:hypothetical protein
MIIIFGISILILILSIYLYFKLVPSFIESFSIKNIEDPVYLFNLLFDIMETSTNPHLNHNIPFKYAITNQTDRKKFLEQITSDGVSFTSPIIAVHTTVTLPSDHISGKKNTGLTTFICAKDHYCLPGSNVEISGIEGLNGTYSNGVSLWSNTNEKPDSNNRIDVSYSDNNPKGSGLGILHSFNLIHDSSNMPSIKDGIYKGYLQNISSNATVTVTHKINSNTPYNEWIAAVLCTIDYLYGTSFNTGINVYWDTVYGRVISDWNQLVIYASTKLTFLTKGQENIDPSTLLVSNYRTYYMSKGFSTLLSIKNTGWINDPYFATSIFDSYFTSYINTYYDQKNIPDVFGPSPSTNIIPALNYLKPSTIKNIYWGLDGTGEKTLEQDEISRSLNMYNVSQKSIVGGTHIVSKLFDWINPYQYKKVQQSLSTPDPQTWCLLGSTNTFDGRDRKNSYLNYYCGLINPEITSGKSIGYIYFNDFKMINNIALKGIEYLCPPIPESLSHFIENNSSSGFNKWFKISYTIMSILAPMMKYLVTDLNCDSIIYDVRGFNKGIFTECLSAFFGDDRYNNEGYQIEIDNGFSFPLKDDTEGLNDYSKMIWASMANSFKGASFRGSPDSKKKVVLLSNYLAKTNLHLHFVGNNGDFNIGSNTYSSIIGSKNIGLIGVSQKQVFNRSTTSSNIKENIEFQVETGLKSYSISLHSVPNGPLFKQPSYAEGFWNTVSHSSTTPNDLKALSGGPSLRNDFSILYYSLGLISHPNDYFIKHNNYISPSPKNPLSWKDAWLEQAIREALSPISITDISSYYRPLLLKSTNPSHILSNQSFIISNGENVISEHSWDIYQFNIQFAFNIESGSINFDPTGTNDNKASLVPAIKSEYLYIGMLDKNNKPVYGVGITSDLFIKDLYAIVFVVGKVITKYNTKITFPSKISILIQGGSQIYFNINGFHMYQGNINKDADNQHLFFGSTFTNTLKSSPSSVLINNIIFQ